MKVSGVFLLLYDKLLMRDTERPFKTMKKIFYTDEYGWHFPGKYLLLGALGIVGLFYFENTLIKIILGVYIFGCIIGFYYGDKHDYKTKGIRK
jgi:hypothetical protein